MNRVRAGHRRSFAIAVLLAPLLGLGLTACGSSGSTGAPSVSSSPAEAGPDLSTLSAQEILELTQDAIAEQSSVTVTASIEGGTFDITVARDQGGEGTIALEGLAFDFIATGSAFYIRGSKAFYEQFAPGSAQIFGDKWLTESGSAGSLDEFESFGNMDTLLGDELLEPIYSGEYPFTVGESGDYNGIPAIGLTTTTPDAGDVILWISREGQPLPLALVGIDDDQRIEFTDWSAPVDIVAPPADEVVDLSQLG